MATERVERPLAAILAADVVGYSRLIGVNEEGTLERLKARTKNPNKLAAVGSNERRAQGVRLNLLDTPRR